MCKFIIFIFDMVDFKVLVVVYWFIMDFSYVIEVWCLFVFVQVLGNWVLEWVCNEEGLMYSVCVDYVFSQVFFGFGFFYVIVDVLFVKVCELVEEMWVIGVVIYCDGISVDELECVCNLLVNEFKCLLQINSYIFFVIVSGLQENLVKFECVIISVVEL